MKERIFNMNKMQKKVLDKLQPTKAEKKILDKALSSNEIYERWLNKLYKEQQRYNLFKRSKLNEAILKSYYEKGFTPIETLNDLSTAT